MSQPVDTDSAVREQLGAQAASVTGNPAAAGVYGDPAGASAPPAQMDLSAAAPTSADVKALLERIEKMEAEREAERLAAEPAPLEPPDETPRLSNGSAEIQHWLQRLHERIAAVEEHLFSAKG